MPRQRHAPDLDTRRTRLAGRCPLHPAGTPSLALGPEALRSEQVIPLDGDAKFQEF
jgi:hypothetical protein